MSRFWQLLYVLAKPGLMIAINKTQRSRVLIRSQSKILVIKNRLGDGTWVLPGGGLHRGEKNELGAVREVKEETGLNLQPEQLQTIGSEQMPFGWARFTCQYFAADLPEPGTVQKQRLEVSQIAWLSPDELNATNAGPEVLRALELGGNQPANLVQ